MSVTVHAPAKINLTLDVVGVREDGYHLLESIFQAVSVYDTVTAAKADSITLDAGDCGCPIEKNTAYKAAVAFFAATGIEGGAQITLEKHIPRQAGMGGGSADAAAVLWALNTLYEAGLTAEELCRIGLTIGADVPFCVVGGTAYVTGIGEGLQPLSPLPDCAIVVAQPAEGISTKEAYAAIDAVTPALRPDHTVALDALHRGDLAGVCAQAVNVFEAATHLEGVADIRRCMEQYAPLCSQMTGSGSCVFAIFTDEEAANACLADLQADYPTAFVCRPCGGVIIE